MVNQVSVANGPSISMSAIPAFQLAPARTSPNKDQIIRTRRRLDTVVAAPDPVPCSLSSQHFASLCAPIIRRQWPSCRETATSDER